MMNSAIFIGSFLGVLFVVVAFYGGIRIGKSSEHIKAYWEGRLEGWTACEGMVMKRIAKSKKINITKEEAWEELLQ